MVINKDKILVIFEELKNKKLIENKVQLVKKSSSLNFKSSLVSKKIFYHPAYIPMSDDSIKFILLHEIGHTKKFQFSIIVTMIAAIAWLISYYILLRFSSVSNIYFISLICLIVFILTFNIFKFLIKKDEFSADRWTAGKLMTVYNEKHPSVILQNTLKEFKQVHPPFNIIRCFLTKVYKLIRYHPLDEERIANIERFENGR